jgi:hypothetical protein
MKLAVLKYNHVSGAPSGIPWDWPAEVREIGDNDALPGVNWVAMTPSEYATYISDRRSNYNTWESAQDDLPSKRMTREIKNTYTTKLFYSGNAGSGVFLSFVDRIIESNDSPHIIPIASRIEAITIKTQGNSTGVLSICRNGVSIGTISLSNASSKIQYYDLRDLYFAKSDEVTVTVLSGTLNKPHITLHWEEV